MAIAAKYRNTGRQWPLVAVQKYDYTELENGVAIDAIKIPTGCRITRLVNLIETAWDGTTPTLDVGDSTTGDLFLDGVDIDTNGDLDVADIAATSGFAKYTAPTYITLTLNVTGTPSQGAGVLIVEYIADEKSREVVPDYG